MKNLKSISDFFEKSHLCVMPPSPLPHFNVDTGQVWFPGLQVFFLFFERIEFCLTILHILTMLFKIELIDKEKPMGNSP